MFRVIEKHGFKDFKYFGNKIPSNTEVYLLSGDIKDTPTRTSIQIGPNQHVEDFLGKYMPVKNNKVTSDETVFVFRAIPNLTDLGAFDIVILIHHPTSSSTKKIKSICAYNDTNVARKTTKVSIQTISIPNYYKIFGSSINNHINLLDDQYPDEDDYESTMTYYRQVIAPHLECYNLHSINDLFDLQEKGAAEFIKLLTK